MENSNKSNNSKLSKEIKVAIIAGVFSVIVVLVPIIIEIIREREIEPIVDADVESAEFFCKTDTIEKWNLEHELENNKLLDPQDGYERVDSNDGILPNGQVVKVLRLETRKYNPNYEEDGSAWSWVKNSTEIEVPENGKFILSGWIKTDNAVKSHVSIIGLDENGNEVKNENSNQISRIPTGNQEGTYNWKFFQSKSFSPKEWSEKAGIRVDVLQLGLNAGWSQTNGELAVTQFANVTLKYCPDQEIDS